MSPLFQKNYLVLSSEYRVLRQVLFLYENLIYLLTVSYLLLVAYCFLVTASVSPERSRANFNRIGPMIS